MKKLPVLVAVAALLCGFAAAQQKKIKVIADQDSAGPQGTNFLSLLMLLRSPQIDLLGIIQACLVQKEVGDATQRRHSPVARAGLDRLIQFRDQGVCHSHRMAPFGQTRAKATGPCDCDRHGFRCNAPVSLRL